MEENRVMDVLNSRGEWLQGNNARNETRPHGRRPVQPGAWVLLSCSPPLDLFLQRLDELGGGQATQGVALPDGNANRLA